MSNRRLEQAIERVHTLEAEGRLVKVQSVIDQNRTRPDHTYEGPCFTIPTMAIHCGSGDTSRPYVVGTLRELVDLTCMPKSMVFDIAAPGGILALRNQEQLAGRGAGIVSDVLDYVSLVREEQPRLNTFHVASTVHLLCRQVRRWHSECSDRCVHPLDPDALVFENARYTRRLIARLSECTGLTFTADLFFDLSLEGTIEELFTVPVWPLSPMQHEPANRHMPEAAIAAA